MFEINRIDSEFRKIWRVIHNIWCWQKNICTKVNECLGISSNADPDLFLNKQGNWIPIDTNLVRIYGSFHDELEQTAAINTPTPVKMRVTDISNGVTITNNSEINVTQTGIYEIQFSLQLEKQSGGGGSAKKVTIWLRKNGINVDWTSTFIGFVSNSVQQFAAWNFFIDINAGDKVELMWEQDDDIRIITLPANSYPATPSVIVTVNKVS